MVEDDEDDDDGDDDDDDVALDNEDLLKCDFLVGDADLRFCPTRAEVSDDNADADDESFISTSASAGLLSRATASALGPSPSSSTSIGSIGANKKLPSESNRTLSRL